MENLLVRKHEIAMLCHCSVRKIDRLKAAGIIRYLKIGRSVLFNPENVLEDIGKYGERQARRILRENRAKSMEKV